MVARFRYSRWDGTQVGFDLDADALLEEMTDDLLYHGDLNAALRRMMQQGFRDRNDDRLMGLREMLERLRADPALKHIPVIMVTARCEPQDIAVASARGISDYVTKPFDFAQLLDKIHAALKDKQQ